MAKNSLNDWSTTPANNTDIAGTNINIGCPPPDVGTFMRTIMSQVAYAVQGSGGTIPATWYVGSYLQVGSQTGSQEAGYGYAGISMGDFGAGPLLGVGASGTSTNLYLQRDSASAFVTFRYGAFNGTAPTEIGSVTNTATTVAYNTTSDARLKLDDGLIGDEASAVIDRLRPRWFRWKSAPDGASEPGFFAQQVHRAFPWAVTKGRGRPGVKGYQPWQMDAAKLLPVVIAELQSLRRRVAELERRR